MIKKILLGGTLGEPLVPPAVGGNARGANFTVPTQADRQPRKITPEALATMLAHVQAGYTQAQACRLAGFTRGGFCSRRWRLQRIPAGQRTAIEEQSLALMAAIQEVIYSPQHVRHSPHLGEQLDREHEFIVREFYKCLRGGSANSRGTNKRLLRALARQKRSELWRAGDRGRMTDAELLKELP